MCRYTTCTCSVDKNYFYCVLNHTINIHYTITSYIVADDEKWDGHKSYNVTSNYVIIYANPKNGVPPEAWFGDGLNAFDKFTNEDAIHSD